MKKVIIGLSALALASFMIACGDSAAGNANYKPANAAIANANTTAPVNPAAIEADIKKLVTDYAASTAKNDFAAFERTTADNFMFVSIDGAVQTKTDRVDSMKSGATKYETLTYDDVNVRVNPEGNSAIVIAKATVKGTNMGKPIDSTVRVTQVWSKMKDGWKMASLQATNLTAKDDKPKMDDKAKSEDKSKMEANVKAAKRATDKLPTANK
jgi:ketosteroid isomerase-like protein